MRNMDLTEFKHFAVAFAWENEGTFDLYAWPFGSVDFFLYLRNFLKLLKLEVIN